MYLSATDTQARPSICVLFDSYHYGYDGYTDYSSTLEALTTQDICNFMKEFNKAGNHITVTMLPEE